MLLAAEAKGKSPRHVLPGDRADLVVERGKLGIHAVGIDQGPVLQMSVRIATGNHKCQAPDEFEISLFSNDLSDQQRAFPIGNLVVLPTGRQTGYLSEVLLMDPQ